MQYAANLNKKIIKYNEFCAKKCIWKCETSMDMTIFFILLFFLVVATNSATSTVEEEAGQTICRWVSVAVSVP